MNVTLSSLDKKYPIINKITRTEKKKKLQTITILSSLSFDYAHYCAFPRYMAKGDNANYNIVGTNAASPPTFLQSRRCRLALPDTRRSNVWADCVPLVSQEVVRGKNYGRNDEYSDR